MDQFLDPSSSPYTLHHRVPSHKHVASPTSYLPLPSFISTRWSNGSCMEFRLPGGHLGMDENIQLNLAKTKLLVFPATRTLQHDFTIQLGSSTITPWSPVRNLVVIFDDQLTFKDHIAKIACRFALHNIRKIRPFLTRNFLSRPLSFPGWTTAMLF